MNVDTMRRIDRLAGVPLCWFATLLQPIKRLFAKQTDSPKRVLLIELSEMGSAILVDPAMRQMQALGAELFFLIFDSNKASLDLLGTVSADHIKTIRSDGLLALLIDTFKVLFWAWHNDIDTVIDLELFSRFTALLAGLSGAGRVVGFHRFNNEGLYRGEMLTRKVPYNPHIHISRNFFTLVEAAWSTQQENPPGKAILPAQPMVLARATIPERSRATVTQILKTEAGWDGVVPLILINANASELLPQRRWPRERFALLAQKLIETYPQALLLLTGAPAEKAGLDVLAAQVNHPHLVNGAGKVKFLDLLALYDMARVMVTNDSGPAHFASVTKMPTIVLFGPETPALYGSLGETKALYAGLNCSPCVSAWNHRKTPCTDNVCLQAITVEEVYQQVCLFMDRPS